MAKRKASKASGRVRLAEPKQPVNPGVAPLVSDVGSDVGPAAAYRSVGPYGSVATEKTGDSSSFGAGARPQPAPLGSSGTKLYAGYFSEEYLQELRGRRGQQTFDEMRRSEPMVAMLLNAVMGPIKGATWEFEAASADDLPDQVAAQLHADLVGYCAKDMIDWETHLHEALTMIFFGFSVCEIINTVVYNHPKFGTFNGLKALAFRSQKTIERWKVDQATGDLVSIIQWVQGDLAPTKGNFFEMLAEFLLVFSVQKEGDNYEGIGVARSMYGPYFRKNLYQKLAAIGLEKAAIGTPVGTIPAGKQTKDDLDSFKTTLENFTGHESAYIMKPAGWDIAIVQNPFDATKIKEMVLLENNEMINVLVANFLALGQHGGGGAHALGESLEDFFLMGLQTYANIVAGVWNRKLIPDLIKMNFGPQVCYPKLKVTGINDKAGKDLATALATMANSEFIKPDMKLETFLRKQYKLPAADPTTSRDVKPAGGSPGGGGFGGSGGGEPGMGFSERRLKLAESFKSQWKTNRDKVRAVMVAQLRPILDDLKDQVRRGYAGATKAGKVGVALNIAPKTTAYKAALREVLAEVANGALNDARKETPKAKNVKLSERIQLAAPRGGYFDALPADIKRNVSTQAALIADTQGADVDKIVSFQYASSHPSSEDIDQILLDIENAAGPTVEGDAVKGMSVDTAAGDAVSTVVSQARMDWFFEPDVLATIESFTFYNEDPISEICQELEGTTWAVGDPDLDRYAPPLHHLCKSRIVPNEVGDPNNPDISDGTALTQKALDSIALCEGGHYHLKFPLRE